jgi:hypothetical protein
MQRKFQSPSTGEACTSAQYIAEILITRRAKKEKKPLPHKFWNDDNWKKKFKVEMIAINSLLKIYDEMAVVKALESQKGKTIYSIRCPWLDELIEEEQTKLQQTPEIQKDIPVKVETTEQKDMGKTFGKKTNISRLRDLDG